MVEIDCLIDKAGNLTPIEIKSGKTIVGDFFTSLDKWNALSNANPQNGYVIYGGDDTQRRSKGTVIGWQQAGNIIEKIYMPSYSK